jgi:hypothetical protein
MKLRKTRYSLFLMVVAMSSILLGMASQDRSTPGITAKGLAGDLAAAARTLDAPEISSLLEHIDLGAHPEAPLSEGRAVEILKGLGIAATTANPDRLLTRQKAAALIQSFRSFVVAQAPRLGTPPGRNPVPATLDDCFQQRNHGTCVECCKALGGGASSCAKECFVINKRSPGEPLP